MTVYMYLYIYIWIHYIFTMQDLPIHDGLKEHVLYNPCQQLVKFDLVTCVREACGLVARVTKITPTVRIGTGPT